MGAASTKPIYSVKNIEPVIGTGVQARIFTLAPGKPACHACGDFDYWSNRLLANMSLNTTGWAMGPGIACPFEISGRAADVTNLRSPFNHRGSHGSQAQSV